MGAGFKVGRHRNGGRDGPSRVASVSRNIWRTPAYVRLVSSISVHEAGRERWWRSVAAMVAIGGRWTEGSVFAEKRLFEVQSMVGEVSGHYERPPARQGAGRACGQWARAPTPRKARGYLAPTGTWRAAEGGAESAEEGGGAIEERTGATAHLDSVLEGVKANQVDSLVLNKATSPLSASTGGAARRG